MPRRILPALAAAVLALGAAACGHGGDGPVTTPPPALGSDASDGGGSDPDPSDGGGAETEEPTAAAPDIPAPDPADYPRPEEHTSELQSRGHLVCRLLLQKTQTTARPP